MVVKNFSVYEIDNTCVNNLCWYKETYNRVNTIRVNGAWDVVIVAVWDCMSQGLVPKMYSYDIFYLEKRKL